MNNFDSRTSMETQINFGIKGMSNIADYICCKQYLHKVLKSSKMKINKG